MSGRIALLALLAGFGMALLMGCGIDTEDVSRSLPAETGPGGASTVDDAAAERLPKRPDGVVEVRGPTQGTLTPFATTGVEGVRVNFAGAGETEGLDDLCAGRIDVLDTSRRITAADRRRCARNGVDLAEPIQVASDAVVVATRNEHDVGGDCLRLSTVNDIFRAGAPISNWSQIGFFDIPLRTTGRSADAAAFRFFAQSVLGGRANGSLADVRADYIPHGTDDGVRREVTNEARRERIIERYLPRLLKLEVERQLELEGIERATGSARRRAETQFRFPRLDRLRARARRALRRATIPGTVGIFRFSYYELYENLLRPMEIWDPERAALVLAETEGVRVRTTAPWCVFPSQTTISNGSYPLSRPLLLYVSKANLEREEVRAFLMRYVDRSQRLAAVGRYVPVPDETLERNRAIIEGEDPAERTPTTATAPATPGIATTPQTPVPGAAEGETTPTP